MLSPQQITANRRNSLQSTGPRTPQGKSASSRNALKTGIGSNAPLLPGESPDQFAALTAAWRNQYPNATPAELVQIDSLILHRWFLHRLTGIEDRLGARLEAQTQARNARQSLPVGHPARSRQLRDAATLNDQFHSLDLRRRKVLAACARAENELEKLRLVPCSRLTAPAQPEQNTAPQPSLGSVFRITSPAPDFEAGTDRRAA